MLPPKPTLGAWLHEALKQAPSLKEGASPEEKAIATEATAVLAALAANNRSHKPDKATPEQKATPHVSTSTATPPKGDLQQFVPYSTGGKTCPFKHWRPPRGLSRAGAP